MCDRCKREERGRKGDDGLSTTFARLTLPQRQHLSGLSFFRHAHPCTCQPRKEKSGEGASLHPTGRCPHAPPARIAGSSLLTPRFGPGAANEMPTLCFQAVRAKGRVAGCRPPCLANTFTAPRCHLSAASRSRLIDKAHFFLLQVPFSLPITGRVRSIRSACRGSLNRVHSNGVPSPRDIKESTMRRCRCRETEHATSSVTPSESRIPPSGLPLWPTRQDGARVSLFALSSGLHYTERAERL